MGVLGCLNVDRAEKKHAGWQKLKTWINSKKKSANTLHSSREVKFGSKCKSTCEEHAGSTSGSDISFENITLLPWSATA